MQGLWFEALGLVVGEGAGGRLVVFVGGLVGLRKHRHRRILLGSNAGSIWLFCWGLRSQPPGEIGSDRIRDTLQRILLVFVMNNYNFVD